MGLRDILKKYNLETPTTNERIDLLISALRRKPGYEKALKQYAKQSAGGDSSDFVGPQLNSVVEITKSNPEVFRTIFASLFSVIFILSTIEKIPGIGSILGASLDVMLMGGKLLIKTVQTMLPPIIGLLPLPYASSAGLGMAAVFGMIVWPMIALISLSRQDFAAAIEAYARAVPPPFGDVLANTFLEGNRGVARINERRIQLGNDLSDAFTALSDVAVSVSESAREGLKTLASETAMAAKSAQPPTGGFHRRSRRKSWRHRTTRRKSAIR